jgi:hypothetical protein
VFPASTVFKFLVPTRNLFAFQQLHLVALLCFRQWKLKDLLVPLPPQITGPLMHSCVFFFFFFNIPSSPLRKGLACFNTRCPGQVKVPSDDFSSCSCSSQAVAGRSTAIAPVPSRNDDDDDAELSSILNEVGN